jgi:hypothetical protein
VISAKGIETGRLGSESSDRTLVGLRGSPGDEARLEKVTKLVKACDMAVVKLLRALGISKVNVQALKLCLARTPTDKRPQVAEQIRRLQGLVAKRKPVLEKQHEIAERIAADLGKFTISATVAAEGFPRHDDERVCREAVLYRRECTHTDE